MKILLVPLLWLTLMSSAIAKNIAQDAELVTPLLNGQTVPMVNVETVDGKTVDLKSWLNGRKTILFFYRGGWCPFCNTQMGQLKAVEQDLTKLGYQLVGISTDSPQMLQQSTKDMALPYPLLSDFHSNASQAFGLAFFASEQTTKRYTSSLKLENPLQKNAQGQARLVLPAPAVYLIDEQGLVQFSYVNPNFKVRLPAGLLLEAAKIYQ